MSRAETYTGGVYRLTLQPRIRPVASAKAEKPPKTKWVAEVSPEARAAWLRMRDEGGWWTAQELGRELAPDLMDRAPCAASRWLGALLKRGHVALKPNYLRLKAYGVTARCIPPAGESLEPVEKPQIQGIEQ
ncbi:hypothetical protein [Hydrogenophaga taeniospiralis]|uniref:hypothetical protein n=1 Tax=Hydrogenophaga taeniospiralis TaxID=65656 RepID=UPI001CFC1EDE|nr:hypothetical protein [Hydrogenophaga taeniospiralis]UCU93984.1 hypothetical protein KI616_25155 [Hydrogenophaga taeniospiralis]